MPEHWFRLPDFITHPTPLDAEVKATPWHIAKTRVADAREKFSVDGSGVKFAVGDTGFDRDWVQAGAGAILHNFTPDSEWDLHGHGTHCWGDAKSMAPACEFRSYKCLNDRGAGDDRWIARAIESAADDGCWIFSGSFGSPMPGDFSLAAMKDAATAGMVCVIAAGNTGRRRDVQWPARSEWCTGVVPLDQSDKLASFGSTGPEVDVGYYGVEILSYGLRGGWAVMSGSSMATPIFAGLLALRMQWEVKTFGSRRTRSVEDVNAWLESCCRDAGATGKDDTFGHGIPEAMEAFKQLGPPPVLPPSPEQPEEFDLSPIGLPYVFHRPSILGDDWSFKRKAAN